jgi:hypothetical protein
VYGPFYSKISALDFLNELGVSDTTQYCVRAFPFNIQNKNDLLLSEKLNPGLYEVYKNLEQVISFKDLSQKPSKDGDSKTESDIKPLMATGRDRIDSAGDSNRDRVLETDQMNTKAQIETTASINKHEQLRKRITNVLSEIIDNLDKMHTGKKLGRVQNLLEVSRKTVEASRSVISAFKELNDLKPAIELLSGVLKELENIKPLEQRVVGKAELMQFTHTANLKRLHKRLSEIYNRNKRSPPVKPRPGSTVRAHTHASKAKVVSETKAADTVATETVSKTKAVQRSKIKLIDTMITLDKFGDDDINQMVDLMMEMEIRRHRGFQGSSQCHGKLHQFPAEFVRQKLRNDFAINRN